MHYRIFIAIFRVLGFSASNLLPDHVKLADRVSKLRLQLNSNAVNAMDTSSVPIDNTQTHMQKVSKKTVQIDVVPSIINNSLNETKSLRIPLQSISMSMFVNIH